MDRLPMTFGRERHRPVLLSMRLRRTGLFPSQYFLAAAVCFIWTFAVRSHSRLFRHIEAAAERLKTRTEDREYTILEYLLAEKKLEFGEILAFMSDFVLGGADTVSD